MNIEYIESEGQIRVDIDEMQDTFITVNAQNIVNIEQFFKRLVALKSIKIFEGELGYSEKLTEYLDELPVEFKQTFDNLVKILNDFNIEE